MPAILAGREGRLGRLTLAEEGLDLVRRAGRGEQIALAEFIETGAFDSHLRRTRHIYRRRRDALVASLRKHLPSLRLHGVAAGLHVLIELAAGIDERAMVDAAARRSIRVYAGGAYRAKPLAGPPAILVGYGALAESAIPEAVKELATVLIECGQPRRSTRRR